MHQPTAGRAGHVGQKRNIDDLARHEHSRDQHPTTTTAKKTKVAPADIEPMDPTGTSGKSSDVLDVPESARSPVAHQR